MQNPRKRETQKIMQISKQTMNPKENTAHQNITVRSVSLGRVKSQQSTSLSVGYRHLSRLQQTNKLCKRHISPSISNHYLPRCKAPEIMEHFLIHFSYLHSISSHILLLLAVECGLLHSQHHGRAVTCHGRRDRSSRKLFLVVLLWSIWREREMTIFESKESDWIEVHDIIKVIVGSWLRLKFNFMSISYFMRDWKACMCDQVRLGRTLLPQIPPMTECI